MATKLDQAALLRVERQRKLLQPLAHRIPEAAGVRLVLATFRSEPVAEAEEIFLINGIQHRDGRPLDDLVLQGRDRERALSRPSSVCTSDVTAVPGMLPDEPAHADQ